MKNTSTIFSLTFIVSILLFSCQKEFTPEDVVTSPPTTAATGDSTYLDKIYEIEITNGITDTIDFVQYVYDSSKRVIKDFGVTYFPHNEPFLLSNTYYYHGTDTVPYKLFTENINGPEESSTTFFYYNPAGQRIKDSVAYFSLSDLLDSYVSTYIYSANTIYRLRRDSVPSYGVYFTKDTATMDNSGNVLLNHKSVYTPSGTNDYDVVSTLSYDSKPSPFARLSNLQTFQINPDGGESFFDLRSKNNRLKILEVRSDYNGSQPYFEFDEDLTGKFIYRNDGYPLEVSNPKTYNGNQNVIYKTAFVYKKL